MQRGKHFFQVKDSEDFIIKIFSQSNKKGFWLFLWKSNKTLNSMQPKYYFSKII